MFKNFLNPKSILLASTSSVAALLIMGLVFVTNSTPALASRVNVAIHNDNGQSMAQSSTFASALLTYVPTGSATILVNDGIATVDPIKISGLVKSKDNNPVLYPVFVQNSTCASPGAVTSQPQVTLQVDAQGNETLSNKQFKLGTSNTNTWSISIDVIDTNNQNVSIACGAFNSEDTTSQNIQLFAPQTTNNQDTKAANKQAVGSAMLWFTPSAGRQKRSQVNAFIQLQGLTPGKHAVHIHDSNQNGAIVCDLGTLTADANGNYNLNVTTPQVLKCNLQNTNNASFPANGQWYLNVHFGDAMAMATTTTSQQQQLADTAILSGNVYPGSMPASLTQGNRNGNGNGHPQQKDNDDD